MNQFNNKRLALQNDDILSLNEQLPLEINRFIHTYDGLSTNNRDFLASCESTRSNSKNYIEANKKVK
jgi:hypothetical protein